MLGLSRLQTRLAVVVVVLALAGAYNFIRSQKQKDLVFRGTVTGKEEKTTTRYSSYYILTVHGDDGNTYEWHVPSSDEGYFLLGDYVVKLPGKKKLAVFRRLKQLRGLPFYLDEEVNRDAPAGKDASAAPVPGAPQAPGPAPRAAPSPSAAPGVAPSPAQTPVAETPPTEEQAQRLLDESKRLWESGDKAGAIRSSEQALAIRLRLYGDNHPLVVDLRNRLAAARRLIPSTGSGS